MRSTTSSEHNTLRGLLSAGQAANVVGAATTLFERGGHALLDEGTRARIRAGVDLLGRRALGGVAPDLLTTTAPQLAARVAPKAAKLAVREVARGIGAAAVRGAALDLAVGAADAGVRWRKGELGRRDAARHVAIEATSGGVAAAAGVGAVAALVAVTGPVGWVTTVAVAGGVSTLTKLAVVARLDG